MAPGSSGRSVVEGEGGVGVNTARRRADLPDWAHGPDRLGRSHAAAAARCSRSSKKNHQVGRLWTFRAYRRNVSPRDEALFIGWSTSQGSCAG